MRKDRGGLISIIAGLLLITAALFLVIRNLQEDRQAMEGRNAALAQLMEIVREKSPDPTYSGAGTVPQITETAPEPEYPDYVLNPNMEMPVRSIDGHDYIGILSLPSLELELPVMAEWSYPRLKINPCRYVGSAYLNNLVICAHNYQSHFGRLSELAIDDAVYFTDMDGNVFRYRVAEVTTLQPTAVTEMTDSGWDLTLFTCTLGGRTRVTVRCESLDKE